MALLGYVLDDVERLKPLIANALLRHPFTIKEARGNQSVIGWDCVVFEDQAFAREIQPLMQRWKVRAIDV